MHDRTDIEYAALFLICMGTYSAMPVIVCWFQMNLGGHHRRSIGTAWQIGFGNIGGIVATYSFLQSDGPFFRKGYSICIAFICLSALASCAYAAALSWENRRREKAAVTEAVVGEDEKAELGVSVAPFRFLPRVPFPCLPSFLLFRL